MGFLDQIGKTISQVGDRAKFEADKFQKTTRLQGEVNDLRRQIELKFIELGQRAYDLQRAGQINAPSLAELSTTVDQLRGALVGREEELKRAQNDLFPEDAAAAAAAPAAQPVPVSYEAPPAAPPPAAAPATKVCASCGFQMPGTAMFCPSCGSRSA